jgi:gustatory receptor
MTRGSATILIANTIHSSSRRPFEVFRTIPSEGWNEEIQRLFNQIKTETYALSGLNLYFVTKNMLLVMAGALVTYELVLLQFNGKVVDLETFIDCDNFLP